VAPFSTFLGRAQLAELTNKSAPTEAVSRGRREKGATVPARGRQGVVVAEPHAGNDGPSTLFHPRTENIMKTTALARPRRFLRDTRGANMVEYIILTGVIALFALFAFKEMGGAMSDKTDKQTTTIGDINDGSEGKQK
jgi:Flp pilus assembly pilin Flp